MSVKLQPTWKLSIDSGMCQEYLESLNSFRKVKNNYCNHIKPKSTCTIDHNKSEVLNVTKIKVHVMAATIYAKSI